MHRVFVVSCLLFGVAAGHAEESTPRQQAALPPSESAKRIVLPDGCALELVACEPDVVDPVAMTFDPRGRLWVVEYSDYPHGPDPGQPGRSRIRILTDDNGDGRYANARVFADRLIFANGLQIWRDGVIVTANGRILFLRDTTGDGRADEQQVWFQGFATENSQLRCSHPTLAIDGWVYVTNGLRGGKIIPGENNPWNLPPDAEPLSISGRDFRFDPLTGQYEAVSGMGQFGLSFDNLGNRYVCDNRHPCRQVVLEEADVKRAPWLRIDNVMADVSPAGDESQLYPLSRTWTTSNLHANQFTAACGLLIYRGDGLPDEFSGNSFVCDPTGNLVHRDILVPGQVTYSSTTPEGVEFLASREEWFRPVNLAHGPDGALYVCDMYRAVIEHPQFMPEELRNRSDLMLGTDRGRIWRIRKPAANRGSADRLLPAHAAPVAQLINWLDHPNSWQRETAFRLLLEQQDPRIADELRRLLSKEGSRWGGTLALWLLDRLNVLTTADVIAGLNHLYAARQALQLRRARFPDDGASLAAISLGIARQDDPVDPHRLAQTLLNTRWIDGTNANNSAEAGNSPRLRGDAKSLQLSSAVLAAIASLADASPREARFLRIILGLHAGEQLEELLELILQTTRTGDGERVSLAHIDAVREFSRALGRRNQAQEISGVLTTLWEPPDIPLAARLAALAGLLDGLPKSSDELQRRVAQLPDVSQSACREFLNRLPEHFAQLETISPATRDAASLLVLLDPETTLPILGRLAGAADRDVAQLGVDTLRQLADPGADRLLLELLPARTPRFRREILAALSETPQRIGLLLDEIEAGRVSPLEIDNPLQQRLLKHPDRELAARAESLVKAPPAEDRLLVIAAYEPCLSLPSDPHRGRLIFEKNCAMCHKIGSVGVNVAPDISDSRTTTPAALLTNILDPNRAIDNNYFSFTILDIEGRIHTGVISAESATSVTLLQPEGKSITLARDDIDEMRNNRVSLMPEGLERTISQQEMADLISFIKNWRYLDGQAPEDVIRQNRAGH